MNWLHAWSRSSAPPRLDGGNFGGVELGGDEKGEAVSVVVLDALPLAACHLIEITSPDERHD